MREMSPTTRAVLWIAGGLVLLGAVIFAVTRHTPAGATSTPPATTGGPVSTVETLAPRTYTTGQCVTWQQGVSFAVTHIVPCSAPHLIEVTGRAVLGSGYSAYPTQAQWDAVSDAGPCYRLAISYLGHLDPFGRFWAGAIVPTPQGWSGGQRTVWCGVELAAASRSVPVPTLVGAVRGQDQSKVYSTGTCFVQNGSNPAEPVACDQPHQFEVTGTVTLTSLPAESAWATVGSQVCQGSAAAYLGRPLGPNEQANILPIAAQSWAAGSHRTTCVVARVDASGNPQTVEGSLSLRA